MIDVNNCGACGVSCNTGNGTIGTPQCSNGKCVFTCQGKQLDCNANIEDGCEVTLGTKDNCSACGDVCTDPAKPCLPAADGSPSFQCGCPAGKTLCNRYCYDLSADDANCSSCGHACDPTGGGAPSIPNAYYGCGAGQCGHVKCKPDYTDCNNDLADGCETRTTTMQNCGGCGIACEPGQVCAQFEQQWKCLCPPGQTFCDGACVDLLSDKANCGACGVSCRIGVDQNRLSETSNGIGVCLYGSCAFVCADGHGDCNNDPSDNCETNLRSDPSNCGGCGVQCAKDQACIGGRCAVEPCPPQTGTGPQ
ncbi:hypothetical protein [Labilithrix luteola]|nr:hypothetical protein [Labilithrix luteola]